MVYPRPPLLAALVPMTHVPWFVNVLPNLIGTRQTLS